MSNAAQVMNRNVISVTKDTKLEDAIKLMSEHNVSGLPVVDESNRVIGILSEKDILDYSSNLHVVPMVGLYGWMSPYTDVETVSMFKSGVNMLSRAVVGNVMSKKVVTVNEGTHLNELLNIMKKHTINRVPVVDENNKMIGIITRTDLINYLAGSQLADI